MKIKCDYCDNYIEDTVEKCPHCGAANDHVVRVDNTRKTPDGVPKTIEELKAFCASKNMPLEKMRFFIGVDYKEPRAFGIYKDEYGNTVVYKNKADGSRAVRYHGPDEAYGVNELYQKLLSEIRLRKGAPAVQGKAANKKAGTVVLIVFLVFFAASYFLPGDPSRGYYRYNGDCYYCQNNDWYWYTGSAWMLYDDMDQSFLDNCDDYYEGDYYSSDYGVDDFESSDFYVEPSDDDFDSDWSSWDSGDTDWSSDW